MHPARAGMILRPAAIVSLVNDAPRASGDDPVLIVWFSTQLVCTPRERG